MEDAGENIDLLSDQDNSDALRNFIEMYETLPELWDTSSPYYMKKNKRNAALDQLLEPYKKIKPNASRDDVRKKINSMRTNYRKELKKILASKRSGAGADEIYKPSTWVFYALNFLKKAEVPAPLSTQTADRQEDNENDFETSQQEPSVDIISETPPVASISSMNKVPQPSTTSSSQNQQPNKRKKIQGPISKQNELLSLACHYLSQSSTANEENNCDSLNIAKVWAGKLKDLEPRQRLFAEKAINDMLFQAQLGKLNEYSVKINENPNITYARIFSSTSASTTQSSSPAPSPYPSSPSPQQSYTHQPVDDSSQNENLITLFSTYTGL